jgi:uncharacterized protein (DUF302 family)
MSDARTPDIVEHASQLPFDVTVERLVQAIKDHGMTLFARIDHAANARDVGMSMPSATVLIYGNAKAGTPIMLDMPLVALDLPLRVLVRQHEGGTTAVAFHPIAGVLRRAGVAQDAAARLEPAQNMLLAAIAP